MSDWIEGKNLADLRGKRILYSRFMGMSLSHFTVLQCQTGVNQDDIIEKVYHKFLTWKEKCSKEVLLEVLNKVPEKQVLDNIEDTVKSQVFRYFHAIAHSYYVKESENMLERQRVYLSGKVWRSPKGIMIDNYVIDAYEESKNSILRFFDKETEKIFETEFENYFSDKITPSEEIPYARPGMKLLSLKFFQEITK